MEGLVITVLCAKPQLKKSDNPEELVFIVEFVKDKTISLDDLHK